MNANLDTLNKTSLFMIPAELTDRIDDVIHLPQGHPVHLLVKLIEVCLYLLIIIWIVLVVAFVEHSQNRLPIAKVRWMGFNVRFNSFQKCFQGTTSQKFWVILPWKTVNYK